MNAKQGVSWVRYEVEKVVVIVVNQHTIMNGASSANSNGEVNWAIWSDGGNQ
jgi:hypothetical protein